MWLENMIIFIDNNLGKKIPLRYLTPLKHALMLSLVSKIRGLKVKCITS